MWMTPLGSHPAALLHEDPSDFSLHATLILHWDTLAFILHLLYFFWHCADQPFGETQSKGPSQEQRKETDDKKFLFTLLWISRALFLFLLLCRKGTLPALLFSIRLSQPPSDLKFPNSESFWSFLHIMPSGDALPFLADNLSFVFCCRETII